MPAADLFLPGFGARAEAYAVGLPPGFVALQPPSPAANGGSVAALVRWLLDDVLAGEDVGTLAGHSMGAALALIGTARRPAARRLVLLSPAGLPLTKPAGDIVRDTGRNLVRGVPGPRHAARSAWEIGRSPLASWRLAREVRDLDLGVATGRVRQDGMEIVVVGCAEDTLVPPERCRAIASMVGATYREVRSDHGHVWPLAEPALLRAVLRGEDVSSWPASARAGGSPTGVPRRPSPRSALRARARSRHRPGPA